MGGGNCSPLTLEAAVVGLSPRGRGKRNASARRSAGLGSIPAWAGETRQHTPRLIPIQVYPRVGGGNRDAERAGGNASRSIPAWAGETPPRRTRRGAISVYPRVGGGNSCKNLQDVLKLGLSPRGRGKLSGGAWRGASPRSIPAWAGETRWRQAAAALTTVYPRVGGGNVYLRTRAASFQGLSPRGRGKRIAAIRITASTRSIPAWAGETVAQPQPGRRLRVYPRVGGGNLGTAMPMPFRQGLSPRGRGKRQAACGR